MVTGFYYVKCKSDLIREFRMHRYLNVRKKIFTKKLKLIRKESRPTQAGTPWVLIVSYRNWTSKSTSALSSIICWVLSTSYHRVDLIVGSYCFDYLGGKEHVAVITCTFLFVECILSYNSSTDNRYYVSETCHQHNRSFFILLQIINWRWMIYHICSN